MSSADRVQLEPEWKAVLSPEFDKPYLQSLRGFLQQEKSKGKVIFPPGPEIFSAFNLTPFTKVRVVILGQDPYHGDGQAHGLSFSVKHGVRPPPSLVNIYKELKTDVEITPPSHGFLETWASRGVLLLNSVLTVERGQPASHQKQGWEEFTDVVIQALNEKREHIVFILWGSYAQAKGKIIDRTRHCVIESAHPSPFSAHKGFLGSKPFSRTNEYLRAAGLAPIDWSLPA